MFRDEAVDTLRACFLDGAHVVKQSPIFGLYLVEANKEILYISIYFQPCSARAS